MASPTSRPTMPSADFCTGVKGPRGPCSPVTGTRRRPPEVSSTAFPAHLPDLHPRPLMDGDFAVRCPLVRPGLPDIRFLFVRSRFCSTLLSDLASRRRPCASLALHLHQVVRGTCTPRLSNMLGTRLGGVKAPLAFEGARNAAPFLMSVQQVLVPALHRGDVVVFDNLS